MSIKNKRILAFVLSLLMVTAFMPTMSFAEPAQDEETAVVSDTIDEETAVVSDTIDEEDAVASDPSDAVASVTSNGETTYYDSLNNARDACTGTGDVLKLLQDFNFGSDYFDLNRSLTLDLNGHTMNGTYLYTVHVTGDGVTGIIMDSAGGGKITAVYNSSTHHAVRVEQRGTVYVKSGTLYGDVALGCMGNCKAYVEGGTLEGSRWGIENDGNVTVTGGWIKSFSGASMYNLFGVAVVSGNAVLESENNVSIQEGQQQHHVTINGGFFSDDHGNNGNFTLPSGRKLTLVNSGEYEGYYALSVGTIEKDGSTNYYANLTDAAAAAEDGDIIKMTTNSVEPGTVVVDKSITINGSGTVSLSALNAKGGSVTLNGNVQITASSDPGVWADEDGSIILNGAKINGSVSAGTSESEGSVEVTEGTVNGEVYVEEGSTFVINGGKFSTDTGNGESFTRPSEQCLQDKDGDGWYELTGTDKEELRAAIESAFDPEAIVIATSGKTLPNGTPWSSEENKQAYGEAYAAAIAVLENEFTNQKAVDAALEAFNDAASKINKLIVVYKKSMPKVKIKKPTRGTTTIRVKWSKLSKKNRKKCHGIEIWIAPTKKFKDGRIIRLGKKTYRSHKVTKLQKKKYYYVKVRSYKMVNGKRYVGKWSKIRKVRTK